MPSLPSRARLAAPLAAFALVFALRAAALASLLSTPLASWHLWTETDEHAYVEWSARLAAGNWADVPAYRAYFNWQREYGPPETWERWYQKNAYYAGPLYPYGLAVLRKLFGSPFLPARLLQLLLACVASAALAAAVQRLGEEFHRKGKREEAAGDGRLLRAASWCAVAAGVLYGAYGPLVFHDFFLYRDGPVAHLSTLLVALPLVMRGRTEEEEKISSNGEEGKGKRRGWAALSLGLLGGAATLMKQTVLPLALFSLYSLSKKSPGGGERRRSLALGLPRPRYSARRPRRPQRLGRRPAPDVRHAAGDRPRLGQRLRCRRDDEPAPGHEGDPRGSRRLDVEDGEARARGIPRAASRAPEALREEVRDVLQRVRGAGQRELLLLQGPIEDPENAPRLSVPSGNRGSRALRGAVAPRSSKGRGAARARRNPRAARRLSARADHLPLPGRARSGRWPWARVSSFSSHSKKSARAAGEP